ncbi:MAG: hypothetical protein LBJ20_03510 [Candidatus Methanoplasma sp.]|nr:hypothetical protein [Candidatus Methanoplasma sp.]
MRFKITSGSPPPYSPNDVLDIYAAMKTLVSDADIRQTVPWDVIGMDTKLGMFMYSDQNGRDRIRGINKKRGRKPKVSDARS